MTPLIAYQPRMVSQLQYCKIRTKQNAIHDVTVPFIHVYESASEPFVKPRISITRQQYFVTLASIECYHCLPRAQSRRYWRDDAWFGGQRSYSTMWNWEVNLRRAVFRELGSWCCSGRSGSSRSCDFKLDISNFDIVSKIYRIRWLWINGDSKPMAIVSFSGSMHIRDLRYAHI